MNHTPGPWTIKYRTPGRNKRPSTTNFTFGIFANGKVVARTSAFGCRKQTNGFIEMNSEQAANARLIAAAPELLATCQELISRLDIVRLRGYVGHPLVSQVRAAIAKATVPLEDMP